HIWAALRQADAEQKIQPLIGLAGARAEFWPMNGAAILERESEMDDMRQPAVARDGSVPEWKSLLDIAARQMSSDPRNRAEAGSTWPSDRRLVYVVDVPASQHSVGIVVELATERQKD